MPLDVTKLKSFLSYTGGGRSGRSVREPEPEPQTPDEDPNDAIGVNGASVNDIRNLIDYTPPPEQGPPVWAADRVTWNSAMRAVGVDQVDGDETRYEAVALAYHKMGGTLVTSEDREEEVEVPDYQEADILNSQPPPVQEDPMDDPDAGMGDEIDEDLAALEADPGTNDDDPDAFENDNAAAEAILNGGGDDTPDDFNDTPDE